MIHALLNITRWVASLSPEETDREIEKMKTVIAEQEKTGKVDLMTNLRAHMLISRKVDMIVQETQK